jgi:uncharacterized membrane-anchored protein YhcB (DUF1043 family)
MNNEELIKILTGIAQNKFIVLDPNYIGVAIFILTGLLGLGYFLLRKFLGNKVEGLFQKDILQFQNNLTQHNELLKHKLYQTATNAELFIKSQHELYPKLYELLTVAHGAACDMQQIGLGLGSFKGFNEKEIREIADGMHVPEDLKEEIKNELPDAKKTFEKYKDYLPMHFANVAGEAITPAMNLWVTKKLYFTEEADTLIKQIIVKIRGYVNKSKLRLNPQYSSLSVVEADCLDEAQELLEELKKRLFQEMKGL